MKKVGPNSYEVDMDSYSWSIMMLILYVGVSEQVSQQTSANS